MADPFEVRMRFTGQLQHLNASVTSAQKAANYALRYRDNDMDLHSCIIEQLEKNNMNNRANIMYFIEHLCDAAQRENHVEYIHMMHRDILRVVDAVAPADGSGAANVKVVRKVLNALQQKEVLPLAEVELIEEKLKDRDVNEQHTNGEMEYDPTADLSKSNGAVRLDKRQIEQRVEEDRERHKRLRENIWAIPGDNEEEFERLWLAALPIDEDDEAMAVEDFEQRRQVAEYG